MKAVGSRYIRQDVVAVDCGDFSEEQAQGIRKDTSKVSVTGETRLGLEFAEPNYVSRPCEGATYRESTWLYVELVGRHE
jgi:hypothetical protein